MISELIMPSRSLFQELLAGSDLNMSVTMMVHLSLDRTRTLAAGMQWS